MVAKVIGIRREDVNRWERRAPLTPGEVARLVAGEGLRVLVQPSDNRIFDDDAYEEAGATVADDWVAFLLYGVEPEDAYGGGSFEVTPP